MPSSQTIPLPKKWPKHVKSALVHTLSLATTVFMATYGRISQRRDRATRLMAELDLAKREVALFKEEIRLKDARFRRLSPRRRPYYRAVERLQILQLKAMRGWTTAKAAEVFLLNEQTISTWFERIDEEGENALLQVAEPVSKFPGFVGAIVRQLKSYFPSMGKEMIASVLARTGLHIGATTVERSLKTEPSREDQEAAALSEEVESIETRVVTSKCPGHTWMCDLTVVPTSSGFWVSWLPHSWSQVWPFCLVDCGGDRSFLSLYRRLRHLQEKNLRRLKSAPSLGEPYERLAERPSISSRTKTVSSTARASRDGADKKRKSLHDSEPWENMEASPSSNDSSSR